MNIKRVMRIATEQPWFDSFKKNVISEYGDFDKFLKENGKNEPVKFFFEGAFHWLDTEEGLYFWEKVMNDFQKIYFDTSVKVFVKDTVFTPVAKSIELDVKEFTNALESNKISFDVIKSEGKYLVAYKTTYKIVEEWI